MRSVRTTGRTITEKKLIRTYSEPKADLIRWRNIGGCVALIGEHEQSLSRLAAFLER